MHIFIHTYTDLARWYEETRQLDEAEAHLKRALTCNPRNAHVMEALASFLDQHRRDKVIFHSGLLQSRLCLCCGVYLS